MGRFALQVVWPAVAIANIGASVHADRLGDVWPLLIWSLLTTAIGMPIKVGADGSVATFTPCLHTV